MIKSLEVIAAISLFLCIITYALVVKDPSGYGLFADKFFLQNIEKDAEKSTFSATLPPHISELMRGNIHTVCYQTQSGRIIPESFKTVLEGTYLEYWLENRIKRRFPRWQQIDWNCLALSNSSESSFQYKDGSLDITLPDQTPPVLRWTLMYSSLPFLEIQSWAPSAVKGALLFFIIISILGFGKKSDITKTTFASLATSALTVVIFTVGLEAYLRFEIPFTEKDIPRIYIEGVGFSYKPNQTYQATNHTDYWTIQRSNSLGFLDREPVLPKPENRFRILVIGDSFVEGQQIDMHEKFQVRLEERLKQTFPNKDIDVVALGSNGTGQSHQLRFYEHFGPKLKADLILLLSAGNDFANNSTRLYSLDYGWDPYHPALLFFEPTEQGDFQRIDPDVDWYTRRLNKNNNLSRAAFKTASLQTFLEKYPHWKESFGDWHPVGDDNRHKMFFAKDMPDIFKDAMASTKESLRQFKLIAHRDNARLMVVAIDGWTWKSASSVKGRTLDSFQRIRFFKEMNDDLSIPFLDLYPVFQNYGNPRTDARFLFDGHWNATGHDWGARAVTDFLAENPELLTSPTKDPL